MLRSAPARRPASKRLLPRLTDERLVVLVHRGNEAAFEELFERHSRGVLSFCTRILGSREEGEDAHQHAFLAVYRAIRERNFEPRAFKPWLYTIARNHCFALLRSRRDVGFAGDDETVAAVGETAERAEQQAEVRELLNDVRRLPEPQRVALLLSELGDLSHAQIAQVIACPRPKVKSLLFQARASLCVSREARETPCGRVREELAGSSESRLPLGLRRHLKRCEGCSEFAHEARRRRQLIAIALPVAPTIGLKRSALAAVGGGGAGSGGGLATGLLAKGGSTGGAPGAVAGAPLGAALGTKATLVVAAAAGVAAVSLVGADVIEAPPHEDSRPRASERGARSGAPERRAPLVDAVLAQRDDRASAAGRSPHPTRPSQASPRRAYRLPAALSPASVPGGGALARPRARRAPAPALEAPEPLPGLDVGVPLLDLLLAAPLRDLVLGRPLPGLGTTPPLPDAGVTPQLPDPPVTPPLPDPGVTPPLPDPGVGEP